MQIKVILLETKLFLVYKYSKDYCDSIGENKGPHTGLCNNDGTSQNKQLKWKYYVQTPMGPKANIWERKLKRKTRSQELFTVNSKR